MSDEIEPTTSESDLPPEESTQETLDIDAFPGGVRGALEAVLMVVDEPITEVALATALQLPVTRVTETLAELEAEYAAAHRGFTLRNVGGGWRV